jgi:ligand-binding sensor domain-containing protein
LIKNSPKFLVLIFLILSFWIKGIGQEPFYWQLTEEDGLPSMAIYQIHQDEKGFMWFGTENGICRYDGKEMETYYHPDLLDNEILTIQEDSWGRIWFKNLAGQLAFIEEGKIREVELRDSLVLTEFCIVENNLIGLFKKDRTWGSLIKYSINDRGELSVEYQKKGITANHQKIKIRGKKIYFIGGFPLKVSRGANYRIMEFDYNENKLTSINTLNGGKYIKSINIIGDDKILVDMRTKLSLLKIQNDSAIVIKERKQEININDFFEWENRLFFVGDGGVTTLLDNKINKKLSIYRDFKFNQSIVDNEGNIWLGTKNNGLILISSFDYIWYNKDNSKLKSNAIYCIYPYRESEILIGQDNGILSKVGDEEISNFKVGSRGRIRVIVADSSKRFWLGGDNFDLTILLQDLLKLKIIKGTTGIKALFIEQEEFIWAGFSGRGVRLPIYLFNYSLASKETEYLGNHMYREGERFFKYEGKYFPAQTYAIYSTNKLTWIGTSKGIYQYEGDKIKPFIESNEHIPYSVSSITQSKDSTIWISTQAHGVLGIKNDSVILRLDKKTGLTTNNCNNLFYDEYNNLWIGSKKGLHKLDLSTFEIDIIDRYDGMPTNDIFAVYARDKIVWVATQKGLMKIPFSAIKKNKTSPPIYITNVAFWEKDTTILSSYELKHSQNNLNIEFVGITYRNRGNTKYQYRMLGVDTNWVNTTTRFARYPLLNPGEYEFQVKAINEDGVESSIPAKINLFVHQPWWQTWWFYLSTFLCGVGLIGSFFYLRFQRIRKKEKQQQEFDKKINDLRMMALQAQMNPHFVFNALSAIQKFLTTDEREQAMIYLARFAQLIRSIFEQSKEKLVTLDEEFEFLKLYLDLEKLRFKDKVKISIDVDETISENDYDLQIPPLLIQPIIENAFKHGLMHKEDGGELKIEFSKNEEFLFCKIEDNGVGRKMAKEMGEGKLRQERPSGLKTAKERLTILNQSSLKVEDFNDLVINDLIDQDKNPRGTRVEIKIKYNNYNE